MDRVVDLNAAKDREYVSCPRIQSQLVSRNTGGDHNGLDQPRIGFAGVRMNIAISGLTTLATWFIVRLILTRYLRYRRKTQSGQDWQRYKAKLPVWVKQIEMLLWLVLWLPLMLASIILLERAYSALHSAQSLPNGVTVGLIVVSSALTTLVPALLLANVVSWLLPPIRIANLAAMQEFATVSYGSATTGLVKVGSVVIPASLAVAVLAVLAPWAK